MKRQIPIPIRVQSEANLREHWRKSSARKQAQRGTTKAWLHRGIAPSLPCHVHLVRIAPRDLDDDNLASGFKAIRDEVAAWIGADDKPGSGITWSYGQERGKPKEYAIRIEVEDGQ